MGWDDIVEERKDIPAKRPAFRRDLDQVRADKEQSHAYRLRILKDDAE